MYSAVVLTDKSHNQLLSAFSKDLPEGWERLAHHMTITMGPLKGQLQSLSGMEVKMVVTHFACDDKVCAVRVETEVPSKNKVKHITLAVNREHGGKPNMSNGLTDWKEVLPVVLFGMVEEVT